MSTNSRSSSHDSSRCRQTFANGQRCRLPVPNEGSRFCTRHAKRPQNQADLDDSADSCADLTAGLTEFTCAQPVNEFLSRLLLLLGQNRISPRRASVLAYIANQILRTIAAMEREDEREINSEENKLEAFFPSEPAAPDELEFIASEQAHNEYADASAGANDERAG